MSGTFLNRFHLPPADLPDHPVIVDLGSNIGYTVADLAFRYPNARVVGVEMDYDNATLARQNTSWCGERVNIVHAAVWVQDGVISYGGVEADSFTIFSAPSAGSSKEAPARRVSTLLADHRVDRVDYLKMDIEGAEKFVLSQNADWLDAVQSMKVELHAPASFEWCREVLEQRGFRCWKDDNHFNAACAVRRI
jgi:FkbM family methyltransferase